MSAPAQTSEDHDAARPAQKRTALVVDDSRMQRKILSTSLGRWGYEVDQAASGTEALAKMKAGHYDFVLSDWMMPGLDGLELCRAFRALPRRSYGYFILLTAKDEKSEVARGLEVGADDFLAKPVNSAELHARMIAGERILAMERELSEKNRLVGETLAHLKDLYSAIDRDLVEARALQMQLVRERHRDFGTARISVMLRPSGHVGGDLVGYFRISEHLLAFYAIDVSGHGVASAMLAARLAGMLAGAIPGQNVLVAPTPGGAEAWPPEVVVGRMNRMVIEAMQVDQYFTCVYALADLRTGAVSLVQAGHPHPLVLTAAGEVRKVGDGGYPVGLVAGARYDRVELRLEPGDRLILMSDGVIEVADAEGRELGEAGVARLVRRSRGLAGPAFLEALLWDLQVHAGDGEIGDDVSAVLYEFGDR